MTYQAYIRCDANSKIGSGHLMRCLTIADHLKKIGWTSEFLFGDENEDVHFALKQSGYVVHSRNYLPAQADLLFVDSYELDQKYESACRVWADKIIVIDDLANRSHDCDVLLDTTYKRNPDDYSSLVPDGCKVLTGSDYALLRPQFGEARQDSILRRNGEIESLLIYLSFTDPSGVASKALAGCELVDKKLDIDIILSEHCPNIEDLKLQARNSKHNITLNNNVFNMAELMSRADIAIGAGGTTSWERCCLGLPTILIEIAQNQIFTSKALNKAGAVKNLGWHEDVTPQQIGNCLNHLINNKKEVIKLRKSAQEICDGKGVDKFAPIFMPKFTARNGSLISVRWLEHGDADVIYKWQSQPETRLYSRNKEVPEYSGHINWIKQCLVRAECWPYIILADEAPVGFMRLEKIKNENKHEVSLLVSSEFYGHGYASQALNILSLLHADKTLYAEILEENEASKALFIKSGYSLVKGTWYKKPADV